MWGNKLWFCSCTAGTDDPHCAACACPRGHYCERAQAPNPAPCGGGLYTEEEGATGPEFCRSCPAGHYCVNGTATPTQCSPGMIQGSINITVEKNNFGRKIYLTKGRHHSQCKSYYAGK